MCNYIIDLCDDCCKLFSMDLHDATGYVHSRKRALQINTEENVVESEIIDYMEKVSAAHRR